MGSSSWFSSSSSTLCCVELLLLAARREKHHQDPKDAKMAALSFGFFVCVSSWLRPDPDWCHVTRVYFPTFFSSLLSLSLTFRSFQRSVRLSPFFFFLWPPLAVSHTDVHSGIGPCLCVYTSRDDLNIYVTPQRLLPVCRWSAVSLCCYFSYLYMYNSLKIKNWWKEKSLFSLHR